MTLLLVMVFAQGTAYWTGKMEQVQTVTGRMAWNCEYSYNGQKFWRVYANTCPTSVKVW